MDFQAGGHDPRLDRAGPARRGLGPRRVVWGAFVASAVVHLLFVLIYPSLFPRIEPSEADFTLPVGTPVTGGIEVMRVVEIEVTEDAERPDEPELQPVEERQVVTPSRGVAESPVVDFARPGLTAAERLRPNIEDRRLWAPLPPEFGELTLQQREELALAGRLAEWYDSVQAAAAAEAALTDWTFTDGDGGRWGVADGRLHLGDFSLPMPVFGAAPGAARERAWQWDEIARQGGQVAVQQTVRERMEAIRARRDAERATQQADTASGGRQQQQQQQQE